MGAANTAGGLMALGAITIAARSLTAAEFGTVVFLHGIVLFLTETATFESWLLVVREGSHALVSGINDRFVRTLRFSIALDALAALLAFVLGGTVLLVLPPDLGALEGVSTGLALSYISLVLLRQTSASAGVLRVFGRYDLLAGTTLLKPFLRLIGSLCAAFLGVGLGGFLVTWFVASAFAYLATMALALRELRRRHLLQGVFSELPSLKAPVPGAWSFTGLTNLSSSLDAGTKKLPLLLVGLLAGPAAAGLFKIAEEVASLLSKSVKTVDRVIFPAFAAYDASGEERASRSLMAKTMLAFAAAGGVLGGALVLVGEPVLRFLFGQPYGGAAITAALLVGAGTMTAVASPVLSASTARGKLRLPVVLKFLGLTSMIASFWPLTTLYGHAGSAAAVLLGGLVVAVGAGLAAPFKYGEERAAP
jgi:O-antigen/teichoic acid export membrane protein